MCVNWPQACTDTHEHLRHDLKRASPAMRDHVPYHRGGIAFE
jgi:hypothetical protein